MLCEKFILYNATTFIFIYKSIFRPSKVNSLNSFSHLRDVFFGVVMSLKEQKAPVNNTVYPPESEKGTDVTIIHHGPKPGNKLKTTTIIDDNVKPTNLNYRVNNLSIAYLVDFEAF